MGSVYQHPQNGEPLTTGIEGNLYDLQGKLAFENHDGSFDFVVDAASQKEREYCARGTTAGEGRSR